MKMIEMWTILPWFMATVTNKEIIENIEYNHVAIGI